MATDNLTTECVVAGVDMEVEYDFTPGRAGVYSGPWDGSYPDEPEEIDVISVCYGQGDDKVDLVDDLSEKAIASIKEQISEQHNDRD